MQEIVGVAAGVPYVALPPVGTPEGESAPLVVAWHLHDPPRSERAMAAALPLKGLPAWRVYLGLPLSGSRLPDGGLEAFFQLSYQDAVLKVFGPVCRQAVEEFPAALAALRTELPLGAVALVSPAIRLAGVVAANERRFDVTYPWTEQSRAVAERLDFVARAEELVKRDAAVLLVVGALDDEEGIRAPAEQLWQMLSRHAPDRTALTTIPEMAHALAEEPGLDPASQTPHAARVDTVVAGWFHRHLTGSRSAS